MRIKYQKYFTTPIWVYIIICIVTLLLFILSLLVCNSERIFNTLTGIGCSLFASLVVGMLADFTNTQNNIKKDNYEYNVLVETLKSNCIELIENMPIYANSKAMINEKHNYFEWIDVLFLYNEKLSKEDNIFVIKQMVSILDNFKRNVDNVLNEIKYFADNKNIDEKFKNNLEHLSNYTNAVIYSIKFNDYQWSAEIMKKYMTHSMFEIFPELEKQCSEKYSGLSVATENIIKKVTIKNK